MKDSQTMQMLSLKTKDIIVSVFYDMGGSLVPSAEERQKLNILMQSVKTAFERKYLSELMENRAKSNNDSVHESQSVRCLPSSPPPTPSHRLSTPQSVTSVLESSNVDSNHTLKTFEGFTIIADRLRNQIFPVPVAGNFPP